MSWRARSVRPPKLPNQSSSYYILEVIYKLTEVIGLSPPEEAKNQTLQISSEARTTLQHLGQSLLV